MQRECQGTARPRAYVRVDNGRDRTRMRGYHLLFRHRMIYAVYMFFFLGRRYGGPRVPR